MELPDITPLILTYNEEANIVRTLNCLSWATRIVVVDSYSSDATPDIASSYDQVDVLRREFDNHRDQWNYGLDQITTEWVLTLDADYTLSNDFVGELRELKPSADGYFGHFTYCIFGRSLRGSLYPPRVILFQRMKGRYVQDGHTQRLSLRGSTDHLESPIYHDDRKPLKAWTRAQAKYARQELKKINDQRERSLGPIDRLRKIGLAPFFVPFYCLLRKGLILDGKAGLYYTLQRTYAEVLLALLRLDGVLRDSDHE